MRWGRACEAGGTPAYWPWRQLCEGIARDGSIAALWARRGDAAITVDPVDARFELFADGVSRARSASSPEAAACCASSTTCTPPTSRRSSSPGFVARCVRNAPLLVVATWRDAEAAQPHVADPLTRVAREATVVVLARLADPYARAVIDDANTAADRSVRELLVRAADGNPLFLVETAAALATNQVAAAELARLPIAQAIAGIAAGRLSALAADITALAVAASVVGREVALAAWAVAAGAGEAALRRVPPRR